jgi:hypothetical protein
MLNTLQINSYQSNLNNAVSKAVTGAKPDMVTHDHKSEHETMANEPSSSYRMSSGVESINKAIDNKVSEYFKRYPNGGSDQEFKQFIENVKFTGLT